MNSESSNSYNKLPEKSELIAHYKPTFLARGGDHLVYEMADHPNSVVKASTFKIRDILTENADSGFLLDSLPAGMKNWAGRISSPKEDIEIKNKQIQELRKYFGREHTLAEKRFLMKVPVTKELLEQVYRDDEYGNRSLPVGAENLNEVWTSVAVQERFDVLSDPTIDSRSLNFGNFVETRKGASEVDTEKLNTLNKELILEPSSESGADAFLEIQDGSEEHSLTEMLERASKDPGLTTALQDFIQKAISYARDTGNILALAGQDNVTFFKKDGEWTYVLVDAIPVHNETMYSFSKELLHKTASGEEVWKGKGVKEIAYEKQLVMKTLNFVRTINGLALKLGVSERLELVALEDQDKLDLTQFV